MAEYAELELNLERQSADSFAVELRLSLPGSDVDLEGGAEDHRFALDELRQLVHDPAAYGRRLGQDVFTVPDVREALAVVQSRGLDLRFRLSLDPSDTDLHGLRWETLADPEAPAPGAPLLMSERILFSRYVDSGDWRPVTPRAKRELRALVVVANPTDLDRYRLAPVDVAGEISRARTGMSGIPTVDVLGERDRASIHNIREQLRTGPDILYMVCHGALVDGTSALWLEHEDGTTDRRDGQEVASWLGELKHPPRLVVLVSCQSAGNGEHPVGATVTGRDEPWTALGPRLGASGVPAVVAMQGNVTMATIEAFMPVFFRELQTDGIVDRAVAVARGAVRERPDAWAPVLYMRLKSGRLWSPPAPTQVLPLPNRDRPSHNLPVQPTPLIGRDAELATLHQMLTDPDARLITLTGPAGVGKTRLAVQAAVDAVAAFPDGVWWVPLAAVSDPALVAQAIASPLGVGEVSGESLEETLGQHLRARQTLLLLDNLEQVLAAAPLIARLLETAPGLRVLATSRAPLRVRAEQEVPVAPLALPPNTPGEVSLTTAQDSPAVQLFRARAQVVKLGFTLDANNAPTIAAICRRLDGLPLAIELAAARVRILSPEQLLGRLDERLKLLTGGSRDLPARQQTLRATIAWSHDLLDPREQALFASLAVFADGCTFVAAETVCSRSGGLTLDVLDGLDSLVQQSLLRHGEGVDSEPRFTMFETIREFALEQLASSGEEATIRDAHAAYFLHIAEQAREGFRGPDQAPWLTRVDGEHDNLRAALGWLLQGLRVDEAARALRLAAALWWFWWVRGHLSEGREWLARALAASDDSPAEVRARALHGAGSLAEAQGDYDQAVNLHDEALALYRSVGDQQGMANTLDGLGQITRDRGDYDQAVRFFDEALAIYRATRDRLGEAYVLINLGTVASYRGGGPLALALYSEGLNILRTLDDTRGLAVALTNVATTAFAHGDPERAEPLYEEALALWTKLEDQQGRARVLTNLGEISQYRGELDRAVALYNEAMPVYRQTGDRREAAAVLTNLGQVARERGNLAEAAALLEGSLTVNLAIGDKEAIARSLENLGGLAVAIGEPEQGTRLLAGAQALREEIGAPIAAIAADAYARDLAAARAVLPEVVFATAWTAGREIPLTELIGQATSLSAVVSAGQRTAVSDPFRAPPQLLDSHR